MAGRDCRLRHCRQHGLRRAQESPAAATRPPVDDLKARVLDEMRQVKRKPGVSDTGFCNCGLIAFCRLRHPLSQETSMQPFETAEAYPVCCPNPLGQREPPQDSPYPSRCGRRPRIRRARSRYPRQTNAAGPHDPVGRFSGRLPGLTVAARAISWPSVKLLGALLKADTTTQSSLGCHSRRGCRASAEPHQLRIADETFANFPLGDSSDQGQFLFARPRAALTRCSVRTRGPTSASRLRPILFAWARPGRWLLFDPTPRDLLRDGFRRPPHHCYRCQPRQPQAALQAAADNTNPLRCSICSPTAGATDLIWPHCPQRP